MSASMRRLRGAAASWGVLLLALSMGLTACRDEGGEGDGAQTKTTVDQAAERRRTYCDTSLKLETVPPPVLDVAALSPAQQRAEVQKFIGEKVLPLMNQIEPLVPQEIKTEANLLIAKTREISQSGDISVFGQPDVQAAETRVHAYDLQNCGWKRVDVIGTDYAFQGIPPTLAAGPASFELANKGREDHEIILLRIKDGVTEPFQQLIGLPRAQAQQRVEIVGSVDTTKPGQADYGVADLRPG
ncbi:MAG: hypothetical protein M3396_09670, partial [Actinomycetota bacterium]|nr:hypothetical protein [Actinomycetota bacterium]